MAEAPSGIMVQRQVGRKGELEVAVQQVSLCHVAKVQHIHHTVRFVRLQRVQDDSMEIERPSGEDVYNGPILVS